MKKSFNIQKLLHRKSKCHETKLMHLSSSRAFQRDQVCSYMRSEPSQFSGSHKYKQNNVTKKRGCKTKQQIRRSDVPTRNSVLCDPKTNQHIQIFPSESSKALLPTTTDHFTQTSLTLAQKQQILIIESELTPSFIKGPESIDIFTTRHTSKDKHTSALMFLSCSCKSFLTIQLNCWRIRKVQQLARAKDLFYCLSVHLYAHLP